jgi:peptide/nickel transport system permease protein
LFQYIVKRLLLAFFILSWAAAFNFMAICILPGDHFTPAKIGIALMGLPVEETHHAILVEHGLDKPWIVQFAIWYGRVIFRGDFGYSLYLEGPISANFLRIGGHITNTLLICGVSMIMAWLISIPIGLLTARRKGRLVHLIVNAIGAPTIAIPGFFFATIFLLIFRQFVDPVLSRPAMWGLCGYLYEGCPMSWAKLGSCILHLLPIWVIVGMPVFMVAVAVFRGSMIDTLGEQYIVTARGKGLSERMVYFKHAVRNALNPLISTIGVSLPNVLTNAYLVGFMFGIPTFGTLIVRSLAYEDPALLGATMLVYSGILVVGDFLADVLLAAIDPRIRYS